MPNLGAHGTRVCKQAVRVLVEEGHLELAEELEDLYRKEPMPTLEEVPERLAEVVGAELAYTKDNPASEAWARRMIRRHRSQRAHVWALLRAHEPMGLTPRQIVRILGQDPGEALNSVRRVLQRFRTARLISYGGERTLSGRKSEETIRHLSPPVRAYYRDGDTQEDLFNREEASDDSE